MTSTVAICLGALAAALWVGPAPNLLTSRLRPAPHGAVRPGYATVLTRSRFARISLGCVAGATAGAFLAPPGAIIVGALAVPAGIAMRDRGRRRADTSSREADVADACLALSGELRAGAPQDRALAAVAQEWPGLFGSAAGRATVGGDPAAALRETAKQKGAEPLSAVAAAWEVSSRTGAALSSTLIAVADTLRSGAAARREADAQLATVRATSRLLALLPVGTLLLFSTGGGAPIDFLLRDSYGLACLVGALVFIGAGMGWVARTSRLAVTTPWTS